MARLVDRLGLSPAEQQSLLRVRRETVPQLAALRERVWGARRELRTAYAVDPVDSTQVREGVRQLALAQARVDSLVAETMLRELALLTPPQRAAYLSSFPWQEGRSLAAGPPGLRAPRRHGRP
jgi:Spy/CpxP family protein refolding chaperone